jgi:small-conductance mechanosensitive channel
LTFQPRYPFKGNPRRATIFLMPAALLTVSMAQLFKNPVALIGPVSLFIAIILAGLLVRRILFGVVRRWAASTDSHLDVLLTETLRGPIVILSVILALHVTTLTSDIPAQYRHYIQPSIEVLWVWWITVALSRFAGNAVRYYSRKVTGGQSVTSLTQKLVQLMVVALGIVWILKVIFSLSLTPLVTAFGVGGLAVALALQDTLSNLFAGFYVSISGLVRINDYIKLSSGEEGFVTDINWRCTTMRTLQNNMIVIPNNKLGQTIFTNYTFPESRVSMSVSFSVGYESDIDRVEKILLEETVAATAVIEELLADPAPSIRFNPGPGDWALVFQVNFHVKQFADQYKVQSELRKLLFKRLQREKISMPFPTKTVLVEDNRAPHS